MKRHGNLWSEIITFDNLLLAAKKAQRGKRFRENIWLLRWFYGGALKSQFYRKAQKLKTQSQQ
ncbi:hypothetical protein ACN23B_25170 [Anabaena sp. FACHB-709]|uniref:Transposase n=2 Tax=Nostocaceae TaxID=1162 RepID=A0A1Z4KNR0_ANAVA|nr:MULTISPECIES: hypothetical protein [Nostocaceae]BAY70621.1 hypothetical protein NIES23_34280 [Trichormus variabilis NIES-23]MBD2172586.1 hypothetical protein [Anabaena cylindrica FACHB-318]MBD2264442.1 hypothetical protein [Anabaena sp. FACHB-709]MBD2274213.1 hypothetical protein [Nostoc sp. PCC 7120 = FACHB-418]MBD2284702.1 hypothetical protein [Anabaena cylindrica FACHB-170]